MRSPLEAMPIYFRTDWFDRESAEVPNCMSTCTHADRRVYQARESGTTSQAPPLAIESWLISPGSVWSLGGWRGSRCG
jgi:hypothetical protein